MDTFDLDSFLPYRLSLLANRARRGFAAHYESEFGIDNAEWRVLAHLADQPGISVRDIQQRAELEKSKVSRAVSRLDHRGFITKTPDPSDSRLLCLQLTDKGHALMGKLRVAATQYQDQALGQLSVTERRSVEQGLRALSVAITDSQG